MEYAYFALIYLFQLILPQINTVEDKKHIWKTNFLTKSPF